MTTLQQLDAIQNGIYSRSAVCSNCGTTGRCTTITTDSYSLCGKCHALIYRRHWLNIVNGQTMTVKCTPCRRIQVCKVDRTTGLAVCEQCQKLYEADQQTIFEYFISRFNVLERMRQNIFT